MKFYLSLFLVTLSLSTLAWRETGHFSVCEIAYRHLTKESKSQVDKILGGSVFAEQCTWPDMVRKTSEWAHTYPWHFINIEDGEEFFKTASNNEGDVMRAVLFSMDQLATPMLALHEKRKYVRFLGHFIGDLHQPLHVGKKSDLGGNDIKVKWFGAVEGLYGELLAHKSSEECKGPDLTIHVPTGECLRLIKRTEKIALHKVWDLHFVEKFIERNNLVAEEGDSHEYLYKAYSTKIDQVSNEQVKKWQKTFVLNWVQESLCLRDRSYSVGNGELGETYYQENVALINERLVQAGHRLSLTLNRIFDPAVRKQFRFLDKAEARLKKALLKGKKDSEFTLNTSHCPIAK